MWRKGLRNLIILALLNYTLFDNNTLFISEKAGGEFITIYFTGTFNAFTIKHNL